MSRLYPFLEAHGEVLFNFLVWELPELRVGVRGILPTVMGHKNHYHSVSLHVAMKESTVYCGVISCGKLYLSV